MDTYVCNVLIHMYPPTQQVVLSHALIAVSYMYACEPVFIRLTPCGLDKIQNKVIKNVCKM